jgi:hypothetical protein
MRHRFEVNDDSGFLALVDHHAYQSFVDADWTYDTLFAHFRPRWASDACCCGGPAGKTCGPWTSWSMDPRSQRGFGER